MKILKVVSTLLIVSINFNLPQLSHAATLIFSDDFESYVTGIGLAGQGGWYQSARFQAPIILSAGNGLSSTVADGGIRTGDLQYIDANIAYVQHSLPSPLSTSGTSSFSVDSYAFTDYKSHASGPYLISPDLSTQIGWSANWYGSVDREQPKWQFYSPGGLEIFHGGFDQPVHLEVIIDGSAGTAYGRLTHSGEVYETGHYPITKAQIASLTEVALTEDFRDRLYLGVEFDSVSVSTTTGDGSSGFVLQGIDKGDFSGISISGAGDINGDGIDDLIIGAYRADPNGKSDAGESYVVFGRTAGFPAVIELASLFPEAGGDGSSGFVLAGIVENNSGASVSGAGDINGDGIDDLIIGAANPYKSDAGRSYVVFGRTTGFPAVFELASLFPEDGGDGSGGFVLKGVNGGDLSGREVSAAGDINDDGIDDLIIGAFVASPNGVHAAGESYVVFGRTTDFPAVLELASLFPQNGGDGSSGFVLQGVGPYDYTGYSVSGAGDINGDGIDDLVIGAYEPTSNGYSGTGKSYVVFGRTTVFPPVLKLRNLFPPRGDGSMGFVLKGINNGDQSGFSVSGAGDINGDGIDDLIIGAKGADPNGKSGAGESYVVFGQATGFPAVLSLRSLFPRAGGDGSNGFVLKGVDGGSGASVSGLGDFNGDGIDDLIICAPGAGMISHVGECYVIFGRLTGFPAAFNLRSLFPSTGGDTSNGFVLKGIKRNDHSGHGRYIGDINGDSINDLIISAPDAAPNGLTDAGETYVVFGSTNSFPAVFHLKSLLP